MASKILGYFTQSAGGRCKQCKRWFRADEEAAALLHFEKEHGWACLYSGTEMTAGDEGFYHYAVYSYGNK